MTETFPLPSNPTVLPVQKSTDSSLSLFTAIVTGIWWFYFLITLLVMGLIGAGAGVAADIYHMYGGYLMGLNLLSLGLSCFAFFYREKYPRFVVLPVTLLIISICGFIWLSQIAARALPPPEIQSTATRFVCEDYYNDTRTKKSYIEVKDTNEVVYVELLRVRGVKVTNIGNVQDHDIYVLDNNLTGNLLSGCFNKDDSAISQAYTFHWLTQ